MIYPYNGYKLHASAADHIVTVVDPRFSEVVSQHRSLDAAMRWVDGYRAGEYWADASPAA